ncbi:MAG TPA: tRNA nucleotidyltransferase, partial [Bacteroidota bacterium]|nr:tRNA nucleotidyltransferase [Bacteroidota bacterium]
MSGVIARIDIIEDVLVRIGSIADEHNVEAYVVGGFVRDTLLGKQCKDIDIVVVGDGVTFSRIVANGLNVSNVIIYEKFGTAMLPLPEGKIEFVTAREERYEQHSRKPS